AKNGGQITISAWYKRDGNGTGIQPLVELYQSGNERAYIYTHDSDGNGSHSIKVASVIDSSLQSNTAPNETLRNNSWHHIVWTISSTTINTYVDGGPVVSYDWALPITNLNDGFSISIAKELSNTIYFSGKIDDVRLYSRALSPDEVGDLYRLGHATISK
ncbi:MAG TPA: LamG domain-containing protein, partial [Patescibacteria group bacterium]|nr:LamG domain-containing protein [Patescibacteria group bacterium]